MFSDFSRSNKQRLFINSFLAIMLLSCCDENFLPTCPADKTNLSRDPWRPEAAAAAYRSDGLQDSFD